MSAIKNPKLLALLACPSCGGSLIHEENLLRCERERKQFPILLGMPCLYYPPDDYIEDQLNSVRKERMRLNEEEEDPEIWLKRIGQIEETLEEAPIEGLEKAPPDKIWKYTEKYYKCINDDEYILSAYGPFIEFEECPSAKKMVGCGLSEGLYSTILNLGKAIPQDAKVVEIGSGIGRTLLDYSILAKKGIVIGLEYVFNKAYMASKILKTREEIEFLLKESFLLEKKEIKGFGRTNIELILTDADEEKKYLPLKENEFDCVIIVFLLGLLKNPRALLEKASRLLRKGGILIVADDHGWEKLRPEMTRTLPSMVNETLEKEGLSIEVEFDVPYFEMLNGRMYHIHLTRMLRAIKEG